jgi:tRNA G10  N-methylase Trm11
VLLKRAVVIFPDTVDAKKLLKTAGLSIVGEASVYIHRSMTKKIFVLEP